MAITKNAGWWDSVRNFLTKFKRPKPPPKQRPPTPSHPNPTTPSAPVSRPQEEGEVMTIINEAGRRRVLLQMKYNGVLRYVEPYSFRQKSTGLRFFGYCWKDNGIECFIPEKIEYIALTDTPYEPRWPVEVGQV